MKVPKFIRAILLGGIIRWAKELGRIDLARTGVTLAKFMRLPRKASHMVAVLQTFAYIKKYIKCHIVVYY